MMFKKVIFVFLFILSYFAFYSWLRYEGLFIHTCSHMSHLRASDEIKIGLTAPEEAYQEWFLKGVVILSVVYKPMMFLEESAHHYALLPSRCPWAQ